MWLIQINPTAAGFTIGTARNRREFRKPYPNAEAAGEAYGSFRMLIAGQIVDQGIDEQYSGFHPDGWQRLFTRSRARDG